MTRLVVRYRGPGAPLSWLVDDERGRVLQGPHQADRLGRDLFEPARVIVVLLPGEAIGIAEAKVAARARDQLARAIPYALEDAVAEPVESLHFAWATRGDGQLVAWIRRDLLAAWVADLAARGVVADQLVPETLALPVLDEAVALLVEADRALVRADATRAFAVDRESLSHYIAQLESPRDAEGRLVAEVFDATARGDVPLLSHNERHIERGHALAFLARGIPRGDARVVAPWPNFATGAFRASHRGDGARRLWRVAAALAGAALVLGVASVVTEWWMLKQRLATLEAEQVAVFRAAFPDAKRVVDPRAQMQAELRTRGAADARGNDGALPLVGRVAPIVTQSPQYRLERLEYRNGALDLAIAAPALDAIDRLRESLSTLPGVTARLEGASSTPDGAEGRIVVARGAR